MPEATDAAYPWPTVCRAQGSYRRGRAHAPFSSVPWSVAAPERCSDLSPASSSGSPRPEVIGARCRLPPHRGPGRAEVALRPDRRCGRRSRPAVIFEREEPNAMSRTHLTRDATRPERPASGASRFVRLAAWSDRHRVVGARALGGASRRRHRDRASGRAGVPRRHLAARHRGASRWWRMSAGARPPGGGCNRPGGVPATRPGCPPAAPVTRIAAIAAAVRGAAARQSTSFTRPAEAGAGRGQRADGTTALANGPTRRPRCRASRRRR